MVDIDQDGKDDGLIFHTRSGIIGAVVALLIGGTSFSLAVAAFPDSSLVKGAAKAFAGGVCDNIKEDLTRCERAVTCYVTMSSFLEVDDSACREIMAGE